MVIRKNNDDFSNFSVIIIEKNVLNAMESKTIIFLSA